MKTALPQIFTRPPVIHSMGLMLYDPVWAQKWHPSSRCEMLHVVHGELHLGLGPDRITALAGQTLLIPSLASHRDEFDLAVGLKLYTVFFTWPAEQRFFAQVAPAQLASLGTTLDRTVSRLFDYFLTGPALDSECSRLAAQSHLHTILLTMLAAATRTGPMPHTTDTAYGPQHRQQLMIAAKQYLAAHYQAPVTLDQIAKALRVSPYYLSHTFSQEAHFSLFEYLTSLRMSQARDLLKKKKMNVSEVAFAVGYDDSHYFSKVFRRYYGCQPRAVLVRK